MEREQILEIIKKENGAVPKPLENLSLLDLNALTGHLEGKKSAYSGQNLDLKTKVLLALAVGIALDSQACIMNNVMAAKKLGATNEEIMETYSVAKFSKSSSSVSTFNPAMEWMLANS